MAGKMGDINLEELTEHKLVNVRDQDGLWKVTKEVLENFCVTESVSGSMFKV